MSTYNRRSEWYITCTSGEMTVSVRNALTNDGETSNSFGRKIFIWGRTWHSKWHEDLLSRVGMNDGLRAESMTSSSCCQEHQKRLECMEVRLTWADSWQVKHLPAWSSGRPTAAQVSGAVREKNSNQSWGLHLSIFIMVHSKLHLCYITSTSIETHLTVRDSRWKRAMFKVIK